MFIKIKKSFGIIILVTVIIVLSVGCQSGTEDNDKAVHMQSENTASLGGIKPNDDLKEADISNWKNIDVYAARLDSSIEKVEALSQKETDGSSFRMGSISLEYYGDDKQCVFEYDKGYGALYFFSKPVLKKESTCNAIIFLGYDVFPEGVNDKATKSDLESYFGKKYKYYKADKGQLGRYVYSYKDKKVVFFENSDLTISTNDYCVLIEDKSQEVNLSKVLASLNFEIKDIVTTSNIKKYETINKYFDLINKSMDEISKQKGSLNLIKAGDMDSEKRSLMIDDRENEPTEFYVDQYGVYYEFAAGDRTSCLCIWLPFKLAFENFKVNNHVTMEGFSNYLNANFLWKSSEVWGYLLKFENDHSIYIPTYSKDGNPFIIDPNKYMSIY